MNKDEFKDTKYFFLSESDLEYESAKSDLYKSIMHNYNIGLKNMLGTKGTVRDTTLDNNNLTISVTIDEMKRIINNSNSNTEITDIDYVSDVLDMTLYNNNKVLFDIDYSSLFMEDENYKKYNLFVPFDYVVYTTIDRKGVPILNFNLYKDLKIKDITIELVRKSYDDLYGQENSVTRSYTLSSDIIGKLNLDGIQAGMLANNLVSGLYNK